MTADLAVRRHELELAIRRISMRGRSRDRSRREGNRPAPGSTLTLAQQETLVALWQLGGFATGVRPQAPAVLGRAMGGNDSYLKVTNPPLSTLISAGYVLCGRFEQIVYHLAITDDLLTPRMRLAAKQSATAVLSRLQELRTRKRQRPIPGSREVAWGFDRGRASPNSARAVKLAPVQRRILAIVAEAGGVYPRRHDPRRPVTSLMSLLGLSSREGVWIHLRSLSDQGYVVLKYRNRTRLESITITLEGRACTVLY